MLDQIAAEAEIGAESRARRRLLGLARRQRWPQAVIRTVGGSEVVAPGRGSWENCARGWCPATVVTAMHWLYKQNVPFVSDESDN
jgi:hypothetical protein